MQRVEDNTVTVLVDHEGYRTLATRLNFERDLLRPTDEPEASTI